MQPDLRTPENSRRNQLRKPGHHYDIEENDDGEETRKKSTDTTDGPKTIPTCTVETRTSLIAPNGPTSMLVDNATGRRATADPNTIMKADGTRPRTAQNSSPQTLEYAMSPSHGRPDENAPPKAAVPASPSKPSTA